MERERCQITQTLELLALRRRCLFIIVYDKYLLIFLLFFLPTFLREWIEENKLQQMARD